MVLLVLEAHGALHFGGGVDEGAQRIAGQRVMIAGIDVFELAGDRGCEARSGSGSHEAGTILENNFYRVAFDAQSGAVKSIFDKELKKELVNNTSPYHFDEYLYVSGGEQPPHNRLLFAGAKLRPLKLPFTGPLRDDLFPSNVTPFGTIAHLESTNTNTPKVQTDVILFDSQKKIEFINHVQKKAVYTKEAVYFAFPFAGDNPQVRYDLQNGFVDPTRDLLPGAAGNGFRCNTGLPFNPAMSRRRLSPRMQNSSPWAIWCAENGRRSWTHTVARFFPT